MPAAHHVRGGIRHAACRLRGSPDPGGRRAPVRLWRRPVRRIRYRGPRIPAQPRIRHHHEPDADSGAPVRADGRDAATHAHCRDAAQEPVDAVGLRARGPRHGGHRGRHVDGSQHRYRRRHGGHDGAHFPAGDAARELRQQTCHRHHLRHRNPWPDHPAFHRPGAARRRVVERISAGATGPGRPFAEDRFGRRSVRRRNRVPLALVLVCSLYYPA